MREGATQVEHARGRRGGWRALALVGAAGLALAVVLARPEWARAAWGALRGASLEELVAYVRGFGVWAPLASLGLMVLQSVIVPLPGSLIAAANGAVFGVWWGTLLSWLGALAGATVSFWLARRLARDAVLRRLDAGGAGWAARLSGRRGFWAVLLARLIPGLSFDLISYVAGLSRIGYGPFLLATAVGMLPGTLAFNLFGNDLVRARENAWRLVLLLALGVVAVLVGRWWLRRQGGAPPQE